MGNKIFNTQQLNNTTWILLGLIILLSGAVVLLQPNAETTPSPAHTAETPTDIQSTANTESAPAGNSTGWWGSVVLALQVGVGAGLTGFLIGFKRGQLHEAKKRGQKHQNLQKES